MSMGGRYLHEAVVYHALVQRGYDVGAQYDVSFDLGVAQVEIAVFKVGALVGVTAAVYLERQLVILAFAEDFYFIRHYLNVAGRHVRALACALAHRALDADGALARDALEGVDHFFSLGDNLGRAVKVAHDYKGQRAGDLAHVFHPAAYLYALARVGCSQLDAGVSP